MAKNSQVLWGVFVGAIIVAILGGLFVFNGSFSTTQPLDETGAPVSGQCELAPSVSVNALNALNLGSSVTVSSTARVNGEYVGSIPSTLGKGDKIEILVNASNYLDTVIDEFTVDCGVNLKTVKVFATDDTTVEIKDDSTVLGDDATCAGVNASNLALGGSDTMRVVLTGKDKQSSGDLVMVVEMGAKANVSDITLSDSNGNLMKEVSVPEVHTKTLSDPEMIAFEIPAMQNAVEKEYKLTYSAESGKDITGAVYTTFYSKQSFVDDDGTFQYGVEDDSGDAKYEDDFDYDFCIALE